MPKGPFRTKNSTESKFTAARKKNYVYKAPPPHKVKPQIVLAKAF